ncbi:hypothetical protein AAU61_04205 [Desulfocarbo indianensis]|nr:hypothetical protein AAU61_04205 [Desulfocarbo indianensis]
MGFFGRQKKRPASEPTLPPSMAEFMKAASYEIDGLIAQDPDWYAKLPYGGAMSREEAREFEIEKRALWRRIIAEAFAHRELKGLRWITRGDDLVCPECRLWDGHLFSRDNLPELTALCMHLGCRCELKPER